MKSLKDARIYNNLILCTYGHLGSCPKRDYTVHITNQESRRQGGGTRHSQSVRYRGMTPTIRSKHNHSFGPAFLKRY